MPLAADFQFWIALGSILSGIGSLLVGMMALKMAGKQKDESKSDSSPDRQS